MTDITDPIVLAFIGEMIRPESERLVSMRARELEMKTRFNEIIAPLIAANVGTDPIIHGDPKLPPLTKADLSGMLAHINDVLTELEQTNMPELRQLFTRRPMK